MNNKLSSVTKHKENEIERKFITHVKLIQDKQPIVIYFFMYSSYRGMTSKFPINFHPSSAT